VFAAARIGKADGPASGRGVEMGAEEWIVVVLVVGARLLLPFTIPYWPLPGAVACMILDSLDQSIFQQFPDIPLEGYQSYDKSLDVYYLAIMYMATMRNWVNPTAFKASFFLYYYRLVGVVIFELSQWRPILFIFPNTFEYFWDFVEAVRMRWNTMRMGKWTVILSVAAIWIFIKLPQEYWIHIAQKDMTDAIKETLFGVDATASWSEAISNRPGVLVAIIAGIVVLLFVIYWIVTRKAPSGDHGIRLKADPLPAECQGTELYRTARAAEGLFDRALLEKVVLTGLISVIFAQYLLSDDVKSVWVLTFVGAFVIVNAFVSQWLARRGREWSSVAIELLVMFVVNYAIVGVLLFFELALDRIEQRGPIGTRLFFVFLFTVITVLFDRYRTVLTARGVLTKRADETQGQPPRGAVEQPQAT
jgi:hypothetical protein